MSFQKHNFVRFSINNLIAMKISKFFFKNLPAQMIIVSSGFNLCFTMSVAYIGLFF